MKPTSRNNGHLRSDDGHTHRQTDSKWPNENVHWNVEKRGFRPSQQQIQFRQWLNREGAFLYLWGFLSMLLFFFHIVSITDSTQTEYCSTFHCPSVCVCVSWVWHFWHIWRHKCHVNHQGNNQNHPGYLSRKDQTRQDPLLRPDQPDWFNMIKRIIKNINAEYAVFTLSCWNRFLSLM